LFLELGGKLCDRVIYSVCRLVSGVRAGLVEALDEVGVGRIHLEDQRIKDSCEWIPRIWRCSAARLAVVFYKSDVDYPSQENFWCVLFEKQE